jgi:hypothetical protein
LATLGQLTATVSHELRNPLGTLRTTLHTLKMRVPNDESLDRSWQRAERNIERCPPMSAPPGRGSWRSRPVGGAAAVHHAPDRTASERALLREGRAERRGDTRRRTAALLLSCVGSRAPRTVSVLVSVRGSHRGQGLRAAASPPSRGGWYRKPRRRREGNVMDDGGQRSTAGYGK